MARARVVFDQMQFARQTGLLPVDGTALDRVVKVMFGLQTRVRRAVTG